jgi:crotonobetaine/carnitine-CoA ligase
MTGLRIDLGALLEQRAEELTDRPFLAMTGGIRLTYSEFNRDVNRLAHGLRELVGPGDRVSLMLPNSLEFMLSSYALKKLGVVEFAVNTLFRGPGLARMLNSSEAAVLVVDAEMLEHVADIESELDCLQTIVCVGPSELPPDHRLAAPIVPFEDLMSERGDNPPRPDIRDTDLAAVLFTSGTSGPAKGCMLSHRYAVRMGENIAKALEFTADDCLYCPFPLYHVDAAYLTVVPALVLGARAAIGRRFSVSGFWDEVNDFRATVFDFMGATLTLLESQTEQPSDADNPVRLAWGVPMPVFRETFERRFGLKLVHAYGLTDGNIVAYESVRHAEPVGSCGKPLRDQFEVAVLDEHDDPVSAGDVGEIAIRGREPDLIMKGYYGMPAETLEAFRNMWLHTGDLGRMDADGHLFFVSRKKDAIRRRGENISAWEVEDVINRHPSVVESAAVGVPSELTEEDVKVFVVLQPGSDLDADELRDWCRSRMAKFMVPDYVQFVDTIPKTPTGKAEKYRLKGTGVGARG